MAEFSRKLNFLLDSKINFNREELKAELGINILEAQLPTFKLFICNFAHLRDYDISFTYGNNPTPPDYANPHRATARRIQGVTEKLDKAKLVDLDIGKPRNRKEPAEQSTVTPHKKLEDWIESKGLYDKGSVFINSETHVRLRTPRRAIKTKQGVTIRRKVVEYKPTRYTRQIDNFFNKYQKKLQQWGLAIDGEPLVNFHLWFNLIDYSHLGYKGKNGNPLLRFSGRWHGEWNDLTESQRLERLSFKGYRSLVEIDRNASILNTLSIWETGNPLKKKDGWSMSFSGEEVDRKQVKRVGTMIINRKNRSALTKAYFNEYIKHHYEDLKDKPIKEIKSSDLEALSIKHSVELHQIQRIATYLQTYYPDISHWFFRGVASGQFASFLESNLMVRVIQRCMSRNLPVVSVYDSIIVPKKHEKEAKEIMRTSDLRGTRALLLNDEQGILNPKTAR